MQSNTLPPELFWITSYALDEKAVASPSLIQLFVRCYCARYFSPNSLWFVVWAIIGIEHNSFLHFVYKLHVRWNKPPHKPNFVEFVFFNIKNILSKTNTNYNWKLFRYHELKQSKLKSISALRGRPLSQIVFLFKPWSRLKSDGYYFWRKET